MTGSAKRERRESSLGDEPGLSLQSPAGTAIAGPWTLTARNRSVLKGWIRLCGRTPSNAQRCFAWLSADAMRRWPKRCYPLKGKRYEGCWCYEIGAGDRVYYQPFPSEKSVVIYYAGSHPPVAPVPGIAPYSATPFQSPRTIAARISLAVKPIRDIRSASNTSFRQTAHVAL